MQNKKFCHTHRFYYEGMRCPFCDKERVSALDKRFNKTVAVASTVKIVDREITEDDIAKLKEKFGSK